MKEGEASLGAQSEPIDALIKSRAEDPESILQVKATKAVKFVRHEEVVWWEPRFEPTHLMLKPGLLHCLEYLREGCASFQPFRILAHQTKALEC